MKPTENAMARRCYGYGRWDAPFWFIGPEQGQGKKEKNELGHRVDAWHNTGAKELSDCREYHNLLNQTEWHREDNPPLQSTWRPLILLLMTFLARASDENALRDYQRNQWGQFSGETCVIELSGLPANGFAVARDREIFRQERIATIRERIRRHKPLLIVMYGLGATKVWENIAGGTLVRDGVVLHGSTNFAFARHPTAFGVANSYWIELGKQLRCVVASHGLERTLKLKNR